MRADEPPKLPGKLSELLRLAVADAQKCEADKDYMLDMEVWHMPAADGCHVCMAGAVLSQSLGVAKDTLVKSTWELAPPVERKLGAINAMRKGNIREAYITLHGALSACALSELYLETSCDTVGTMINDSFDCDLRRASWDVYLRAADMLEQAGL